jgi:hypothetical protein
MIMKDCIFEDIKLYFNTQTLFIMLPNPAIMRTRSINSKFHLVLIIVQNYFC